MKKSLALSATAVGLFMGLSSMAQSATLNGATVNVDFYYPDLSTLYCSNGSSVVGAGVEYGTSCSGFNPVSIDVTGSQVIVNLPFSSFSSASFNGFIMDILSGPTILSLAYNVGLSTMGSSGTSFTGTSMTFNFQGQQGGVAIFDVGVSAVPLPAALPLLAAGLGGLGLVAKRRRKAAA